MRISVHLTRPLLAAGLAMWAGANTTAAAQDLQNEVGFVRNEGQVKDQNGAPVKDVLYLADVDGIRVQLRRTGFSYQVVCSPEHSDRMTLEHAKYEKDAPVSMERIDFDLALAQAGVPFAIEEGEELPGVLNYIHEEEIYGVKAFRSVKFVGAWAGADLLFEIVTRADGKQRFKYSVIAHEGTSIASLGMNVRGLSNRRVDGATIRMEGAHFGIEESIPESWLLNEQGVKVPVEMAYATSDASDRKTSFTCMDRSLTTVPAGQQLVIDPTPTRVWGRYYGGTATPVSEEYARVAVKNSGTTAIALSGSTMSPNIATAGAHDVSFATGIYYDAFAASFNSAGGLTWATYYGSDMDDRAFNVAIDAAANVYACGTTRTQGNGVIATLHQVNYGGGIADGYLVKFDRLGQRLWGTYYGGSGEDRVMSVRVDPSSGYVYIGGESDSPALNFRLYTTGAWQTTNNGSWDLFLAKFDGSGMRQWGTYYGGSGLEQYGTVTTDNDGNVYLGGGTQSANLLNVVASPGTWQTTYKGNNDGLLVKFTPSGTRSWGTYYGGIRGDNIRDISVDCTNAIWVCGGTSSQNWYNVIATPGAHKTWMEDTLNDDGFMAKFTSLGARTYGSYYGGAPYDYFESVSAAGNDLVYFGGYTQTPHSQLYPIATAGSYEPNYQLGGDAFFTLFSSAGVRTWGTYYGGPGPDICTGVEYFAGGKIVIGGTTSSATGIASGGSPLQGSSDWYIAQFNGTVYTDCIPVMPLAPTPPMSELCELMNDGVIHDASTGTLLLNPSLCTACGLNVFDLSGRRVFTTQVNSDRVVLPEEVRTNPFIVQVVSDKGACSKVIVPDPAYAR